MKALPKIHRRAGELYYSPRVQKIMKERLKEPHLYFGRESITKHQYKLALHLAKLERERAAKRERAALERAAKRKRAAKLKAKP